MWGISYWVFPVISGLCWLGMILSLLIHWTVGTHRRHYPSMDQNQSIAYISDTGAFELKPLFIAGCSVTTVFLDLAFLSERWLRHSGRLVPNTTMTEKLLAWFSIVFAGIGTAGLILLSIFDTNRHPTLHDIFLLLFIAGYIVNAILVCAEYQRLGIKNRNHPILRASFWIKLVFIVVAIVLAIAFGACNFKDRWNAAAVLEWTIAFIFTFYIFSFFIDLLPAVRTRHHRYIAQDTELEREIEGDDTGEMRQHTGRHADANGAPRSAGTDASKTPPVTKTPPLASNF